MTGKTHIAVGTAVAVAAVHPTTFRSLVVCIASAVVGSVVSDVDVTTSDSHRDLIKISSIGGAAVIGAALIEKQWQLGILSMLRNQTNLWRLLSAAAVFLLICWFGMHQPHRSFMHSLSAIALLTVVVAWMFPSAALPFAAAMASHIILDLLNRRKVRILYPLHWGISLNLCPSQGHVNNLICLAGSCLFASELLFFSLQLVMK